MKVIYINYVDFNNVSSGSSVRPKKMYEAFRSIGYEVTMLTGLQNKFKERWINTWRFFKDIRNKEYDICYVESPSGPIFNFCDHLILFYINKVKKIPIGFFYRDAYWKFGQWYKLPKFKRIIINLMHRFDLFVLKRVCDKIYFPSKTMADLFNLKNKSVFPPGGTVLNEPVKQFNQYNNCIYVGGVSERYGTEILLEAFRIANSKLEQQVTLTLICRSEIDIMESYKQYDWLKVYTGISGEENLKSFYEKADMAVIPFKRDVYMDFAIPIKLFEYMSNNIPIVSTDCIELSKFIKEYEIGIITKDNAESLADGIIEFYEMELDKKNKIHENLNNAIQKNSWENRARQLEELVK